MKKIDQKWFMKGVVLWEQLKQLDRQRQITFGIGLTLILTAVLALTYWVFQASYVPLFAELSPDAAAAVVAQMDAVKADYRLDSKSGAVLVREDQRDRIRMQLMEHGIPVKGQVGYEIFDHSDFGMTEFTEKMNYQRALEGELARTIMTLDSIQHARLHIVLPDPSLFKREKDPPKASVALVTRVGSKLTAEQIEGIQRLVASAVPGLNPEMVTVHDHRGINLVPQGPEVRGETVVSRRMQAKEATENYIAGKVYQILSGIFPKGQVSVSVDASLRLDHVVSTRDQVLPAGKGNFAISRIHANSVKGDIAEAVEKAEVGVPPKPTSSANNGANFDVEYQIGRLHEQAEEMPGQIERLSVGVIVPSGSADATTIEKLRQLIASTVGADFSRGDNITIFPVQGATNGKTDASSDALLESGSKEMVAIGPWQISREFAFSLMLAAIGLLAGAGLVASLRSRHHEPADLTTAEREALLAKTKAWLQQDATGGAS